MLKSLVVILPMLLGAMLARIAHAETAIVAQEMASPTAVEARIGSPPTEYSRSVHIDAVSTADAHTATFIPVDLVQSASHLPEPAGWAMLLVGSGAIGGLLRRRRANMIAA